MNGILGSGLSLPATNVVALSPERPLCQRRTESETEILLAALRFPPRSAEARRLGEVLPDVLASYGITARKGTKPPVEAFEAVA